MVWLAAEAVRQAADGVTADDPDFKETVPYLTTVSDGLKQECLVSDRAPDPGQTAARTEREEEEREKLQPAAGRAYCGRGCTESLWVGISLPRRQ